MASDEGLTKMPLNNINQQQQQKNAQKQVCYTPPKNKYEYANILQAY